MWNAHNELLSGWRRGSLLIKLSACRLLLCLWCWGIDWWNWKHQIQYSSMPDRHQNIYKSKVCLFDSFYVRVSTMTAMQTVGHRFNRFKSTPTNGSRFTAPSVRSSVTINKSPIVSYWNIWKSLSSIPISPSSESCGDSVRLYPPCFPPVLYPVVILYSLLPRLYDIIFHRCTQRHLSPMNKLSDWLHECMYHACQLLKDQS